MLFPTVEFLVFFLIVFAIGIFLKPKIKAYKYYLLAVSGLFYASWSLNFLALLVVDIVANFFLLRNVYTAKRKKLAMFLGIMFNLIFWGYLKYYNFFADGLFQLLYNLNLEVSFEIIQVIAPLGISFYTFRIISHYSDAMRGLVKKPSFIDFANFVAFFPQIASGPIAKAGEFYEDLNGREFKYETSKVLLLILSGLFKKYVLASFIFTYIAEPFTAPTNFSAMDLSLAALGYTAMIYLDFSGYTDLSTAIGNLLGFRVPVNFNMPYQAKSLKEFWRRWHMTLGAWLKWNIYIPLGGNRKGVVRKYINLLITMTFAGFWHGAGLNYVIWGVMHGAGLVVNQMASAIGIGIGKGIPAVGKKILQPFVDFSSWAITLGFVTASRIVFNTRTLDDAGDFFNGILTPANIEDVISLETRFVIVIAFVIALNFFEIPLLERTKKFLDRRSTSFKIIFALVAMYIILSLGPEQVAPFIYFQF